VGLSRERVGQLRRRHGIESQVKGVHCDPFWTEEKVGELLRLDPLNVTYKEARKLLGCDRQKIFRKLQELGLPSFLNSRTMYTPGFIKTLYDKHEGNMSKMAKELEVPYPVMARECGRQGLKGKGRREGNGGPGWQSKRYQHDDEVLRLWRLYDGNQYKIEQHGTVPRGSVHSICVRLGLLDKRY